MTVKSFLNRFSVGRSTIKKVRVVNSRDSRSEHTFNLYALAMGEYGSLGDLKIITFTVEDDELVIYAR